jgi:hypothetical protein
MSFFWADKCHFEKRSIVFHGHMLTPTKALSQKQDWEAVAHLKAEDRCKIALVHKTKW